MEALLLTIIGTLLGALLSAIAAWWKARSEGRAFELSYKMEKERADRLQSTFDRHEQAIDIATKTAEALHALMQKPGGGAS